ncbi:hypothetical protein GX408_16910 [bacterium]|nr:hypothetical protein [bacterium]
MLRAILSKHGRVYDFAYDSDTAEKIAEEMLTLSGSWDWALVKIGASAADEVKKSTELIRPKVGVITNIGEAHLAVHGTIEKIMHNKAQLLEGLEPGGWAVLNRDNEYVKALGERSVTATRFFGLSELADYFAANITPLGPEGTAFTVHRKNNAGLRLHLPIYSLGDVYNALAAIAVADGLGVPDTLIADGLEHDFMLPEGRGRLYRMADLMLFDDTYDATPQSLIKSTVCLMQCKENARRLVLVLGDMTELGSQADSYQKMIGHYLAGMPIDLVVLCGKRARSTAEAMRSGKQQVMTIMEFPLVSQVIEFLLNEIRPGDAVMVEGGANQDLSAVVQALRRTFEKAPETV